MVLAPLPVLIVATYDEQGTPRYKCRRRSARLSSRSIEPL